MKKDNLYNLYQKQIKDKDTAVLSFITETLAKTASMFEYNNLPPSIPAKELERILQTCGHCYITEVNGELYALKGNLSGMLDAYERPTEYIVNNVALNLSKVYNIENDGVLMRNDSNGVSLLPLIGRFAVLYTDARISLNTASILSRLTMVISASDDKTKESADDFVKKIIDGDFSVIGENAFFKGVTFQSAPHNGDGNIGVLIELLQYYKASLLNSLGLNANYNMKRERLNLGEVSMNIDLLYPYVDNLLNERQTAVNLINEKYGTDISVNLSSSWKFERENYEKLLEDLEEEPTEEPTQTEEEPTEEPTQTEEEPTEEPTNEPSDEPTPNEEEEPTEEEQTKEEQTEDEQTEEEKDKKE